MHSTYGSQLCPRPDLQELGLSDDAVAAVKRVESPTKRLTRLAGAMRRQGHEAWGTLRPASGILATACNAIFTSAAALQSPRALEMASMCALPSFHAHSAQFMARLQQDLATRETRVQELQNKWANGVGQGWE